MNPIKPNFKTEIFPVVILLITIGVSFYFYSRFGEVVVTHWNVAGEPDGWSSKLVAAFLFPAVIFGMYLLFLFLPYFDPRRERYGQFSRVYHFFKDLIIFFMAFIYFLSSGANLGYKINMELWIPIVIGVMFVLMGNYMGKIKSNWFIGIRTPWTLSSEEAWNKTHRFSGWLFMVGGLLMILTGLAPVSFKIPIFIVALFIIIFGTIGYSYIAYRQEEKKN